MMPLYVDGGRIDGEPWKAHRSTGLARDKFFTEGPCAEIDKEPHGLGRYPANVALDEESAAMLDEQSGILTSGNNPSKRSADKHRDVYAGWKGAQQCLVHRGTDSGGASRFFYTAKADQDRAS